MKSCPRLAPAAWARSIAPRTPSSIATWPSNGRRLPRRSASRYRLPKHTTFRARASCRRTAVGSRSKRPGRMAARSCGCGRSMRSTRGPWQELRASAPVRSGRPDSRFLAFGVNGFPGRLKKVAVSGGPPQTLCEYTGGFREGAWNADGRHPLWRLEHRLAASVRLGWPGHRRSPGSTRPGRRFSTPGRHSCRMDATSSTTARRRLPENTGIYLGSLDATPEESEHRHGCWPPTRTRCTCLHRAPMAGSSCSCVRARCWPRRSTVDRNCVATPSRIAEDVGNLGSYGWFSASPTGALAFRTGLVSAANVDLVWFDRQGKRLGQLGPRLEYGSSGVQLSPDGKRVVVDQGASRGSQWCPWDIFRALVCGRPSSRARSSVV